MGHCGKIQEVARPRVLFLEGNTGMGGSGSFLFYVLQHLNRERFDVRLSTYLSVNTRNLNALIDLGIPYVPLSDRDRKFLPYEVPIVRRCRNRYVRKVLLALAWLYKL